MHFGAHKQGKDDKKSNTMEKVRVCCVAFCRLCLKSFVVETISLFCNTFRPGLLVPHF